MIFLSKLKKIPSFIIFKLGNKNNILINDKLYLKNCYRLAMNKKIDIEHPISFNEKLQWLKLYDRKKEYTKMVDKYESKLYVSKIIGEEYIIPTLALYDSFDEIDFSKLPNQFVIKTTHDSGGVVICKNKNKFNINLAKKKINNSLKNNYYYSGREWPYKNVKPKIIIEEYMEDSKDKSMQDYKLFCFNGEPKYILVCSDRDTNLKETFFNLNWGKAPFKRSQHETDYSINRPSKLEEMKKLAKKLSKDIPFLRVDFYEINNKVYFGELTFYPASGFSKFDPEMWDKKLGEMIKLPSKKDMIKNEK